MSFQEDIFTALSYDSGVTSIVGDRIFADVADGTTAAPYLVYQVISTGGETTHNGTRDIEFPTVQFSAWANTKQQAVALASAVTDLLDGNTLPGSSRITFVWSDQSGTYESETNLFGETLDFRGACNRN